MITTDKVTEIFCILDEFCKNLDAELTKNLHIVPIDEGYKRMRNRKEQMSKSEIMACSFTPSLRTSLPHESLCGIGCILFLRE